MNNGVNARRLLCEVGITEFIMQSYVGIEKSPDKGKLRRVFKWEENGTTMKGNVEAFVLHLGKRLEANIPTSAATIVHEILRSAGHPLYNMSGNRAKKDPNSPLAGRFRQPDPDQWAITH